MTVQFFDTLDSLGRSLGSGPTQRRLATVAEVNRGHHSVLAQFRAKAGRWVLTIEMEHFVCADCGEPAGKFIQFMALEDGCSAIGECVSNRFLDEHQQLSTDQQYRLRSLGWQEPLPPQEPNWFFEASSDSELRALDAMTRRTLNEVFGLDDPDLVEVSFRQLTVESAGPALT